MYHRQGREPVRAGACLAPCRSIEPAWCRYGFDRGLVHARIAATGLLIARAWEYVPALPDGVDMERSLEDAIWASLPVAALVLDANGQAIYANPAAESLFNRSARDITASRAFAHMLSGPRLENGLRQARQSRSAVLVAGAQLDRRGAPPVIADLRISQLAGRPGWLLACIHSREIEDALSSGRQARKTARSASGMAAILSHEIKNPLAAIIGASQLLAMNLESEDREWTSMIEEEAQRILSLLAQVDEFGAIDPPRAVACNIHDILERARKLAQVGCAVGVPIKCEFDPSLPFVLGDPDQLLRVFINLLTNATQAIDNRDGMIQLRSFYDPSLRLRGADGHHRTVPIQVEVIDDGPGLPNDLSGDLFEPFVSGRDDGAGLGLAIVSKILSEHGGWIATDSQPGRTMFRISLPEA